MDGGFQNRRKIHFIKKGFQAAFIATFVAVAVVSVAASALALDVQVHQALRGILYRSHLAQAGTGQVIFPLVARVVGVVFACFLGVVLVLTLLVMTLVGRELRALERAMARLGEGDLAATAGTARWIPEAARLFDRAARALRDRTDRTSVAGLQARQALDLLRDPPREGTADDAAALLERAADGLADLDRIPPIC